MVNVCLLGDSIFDNRMYVAPGPDVAAQLRSRLSAGDSVHLLAVDGSVTSDVARQARRVPEDASHIVLSSGGNDALALRNLLYEHDRGGPEVLAQLSDRVARFRAEYHELIAALRRGDLHQPEISLALCTIYEGSLGAPAERAVPAAVAAFNDAIYRVATMEGVTVIELREWCTEAQDYANAIEPSVAGGEKIASAIAAWISSHAAGGPGSNPAHGTTYAAGSNPAHGTSPALGTPHDPGSAPPGPGSAAAPGADSGAVPGAVPGPAAHDTPPSASPSKKWLIAEAAVIFGGIPMSFLFDIPRIVTGPVMLAAIAYTMVQGRRAGVITRARLGLNGFRRFRHILLLFLAFALGSTAAVAMLHPSMLFLVVRTNIPLWLTMLVVYCLFSVYPQTLLYRTFFMERYRPLFRDHRTLVLVNAAAFAWAHNIIPHPLVYLLTFAGGILFSRTWLRSRSTLAVSIEHALYGFWLFTVGLGSYFAFPGG